MIFKSQTPWPWRVLRILLITALVAWLLPNFDPSAAEPNDPNWPKTDFSQRSVPLKEIIGGGPPKDGIPALDQPKFITPKQAAVWLDSQEPVIVVQYHQQARAYPLHILLWHEIVNDTFDDLPLSITFCPLCNSALVFERRLDGQLLDFGTTGKLRHSDMVMYDRQTESWWQQFTGQAIVGQLNGKKLKPYPSNLLAFSHFVRLYPEGQVLSRETGYQRDYGNTPYAGYDDINSSPFLLTEPADSRLPALAYTLGIQWQQHYKLYPLDQLQNQPLLNDRVQKQPVVIFNNHSVKSVLDQRQIRESRSVPTAHAFSRRLNSEVLQFHFQDGKIMDQSGSEWNALGRAVTGKYQGQQLQPLNAGVHFAFAWLAFQPKAEIYTTTP